MTTPITRKMTALAAAGALALGAAACGGGDDAAETGGSSAGTAETQPAQTAPVAALQNVTGESTSVTLDAGFVEALDSLGVEPGVADDASLEEGVVRFPITGGNVEYYGPESDVRPFVQGRLDHDGSGLSLTAGGTTVELTDFVVDPGTSMLTGTVSAGGEVAAQDAPLFFLDGRTLEPLSEDAEGRPVLEGTTVKLTDEAAQLLNQTFGIEDLAGGLEIGIARIVLEGS
jgi:hypothetical protein